MSNVFSALVLFITLVVFTSMGQFTLRSLVGSFIFGLFLAMLWQHYPRLLQLLEATLPLSISGYRQESWSMKNAVRSYLRYEEEAGWEPSKMRNTYAKIGLARRHIGKQLGYPAKLDRFRDTIKANAKITQGIAKFAEEEYGPDAAVNGTERTDLYRVREALKHFVRDWSFEGEGERKKTFQPILDELSKGPQDQRGSTSVLVPGSGLGRLAWEISQLGFNTTANELSYFMILAFRFLLSGNTTSEVRQHTIHPHSHWFSHQRSTENLMRAVQFPDVIPRLASNFHLLEGDFMSLLPERNAIRTILPPETHPSFQTPYQESLLDGLHIDVRTPKSYDYIVTLFFIDTSTSILNTLSQIHTLLKPDGVWINLGPLLWTSGAQTVMELSLDEMLKAVELTGFELDILNAQADEVLDRTTRAVECEYTADKEAMMRWIYEARYWVARKH